MLLSPASRWVAWAGPKGLTVPPCWGVAVWLSDMMATPPDQQMAVAGLTVGPDVQADQMISIREVPGGRHAVVLHKGPFTHVGRAYDILFA